MSLRIALVLTIVLLALVAFNLVYAFGLSAWVAMVPVLVSVFGIALVYRASSPEMLLMSLLGLTIAGLLAVALVLLAPAWQVIHTGSSASWAGRMAPVFVAAMGLYVSSLWIEATARERGRKPVDRIADLLSGPRLLPALVTSLIVSSGFVLGLEWLARSNEASQEVTRRFLERGIIPPVTVLLFVWGMLLLLGKRWNSWHLGRALAAWDGGAPGREAGEGEGAPDLDALVSAPSALEETMQFLWRRHEESYLIPRYIGWAVPILGFIGTVLGISLAAEGIRRIIVSEQGLTGLSSDLGGAIAPLGIAFDTTLIALSLSIVLSLFLSLVQRSEERTLSSIERSARRKLRVA